MAQKVGYEKITNSKELQEGGLFKVESDRKAIVLSIVTLFKVNAIVYCRNTCYSHEPRCLGKPNIKRYNLRSTCHYTIFDMQNTDISDRTVGQIIFVTFR
jgi:hypothetical protein